MNISIDTFNAYSYILLNDTSIKILLKDDTVISWYNQTQEQLDAIMVRYNCVKAKLFTNIISFYYYKQLNKLQTAS